MSADCVVMYLEVDNAASVSLGHNVHLKWQARGVTTETNMCCPMLEHLSDYEDCDALDSF